MALQRPPQHHVDARITFVHPADDAWDNERIRDEQAAMLAAGQAPKNHPMARYFGGWTRYHIDAEATVIGTSVAPRHYLLDGVQPTTWRLRRLTHAQWQEVFPLYHHAASREDKPFAAYLLAAKLGIERVDNGPDLELTGGRLTASDLAKLHEIHHDLVYDLGEAVYQASMDLREDEKRPLG